jgi:two-component system cell cycle response regulator
MKILVADDDAVSRRMMAHMLQSSGYEVVLAENGLQAAHELEQPGAPRLALIDWMMPGLDGPGLCREIRSRHTEAYVYILLLTSKQSNEDAVSGLEAGADDYLRKPCHPQELKARLRTGRRILQLEDRLVDACEQMHFKATHDALTSLWNRGAILALLESELNRSVRQHSPVSVLLCDVDHFKKVNDSYGHMAGDEVLQEVSVRLQSSVRSHDAVGRYGGEEFLIVLGGCDEHNLRLRAEQLHNAISAVPVVTKEGSLQVSVSVGAITIDNWSKSTPLEPFLKQADEALYRAKAAGRNQVVYANSLVGISPSL